MSWILSSILFENGNIVKIEGNTRVDCAKAFEKETPETYKKRWNMEGKSVYSQNLFIEKAVQFIRDNKDKPFSFTILLNYLTVRLLYLLFIRR